MMHNLSRRTVQSLLVVVFVWSGIDALAQTRPAASVAPGNSQKAGLKGDAVIQYDIQTNSLIVVTDAETNEQIGEVVKALDQPVPQVLIKVLFLEVTHTNNLDLGAEFTNKNTWTGRDGTQVDSSTIQTIFGIADQTSGAFYHIIDKNLDATIHALAQVTKLEVLSRPSILTRNHQQAVITVGKRVPFIQNSRITQYGETINTVTYDDIGIILQVTPHITDDRIVSMDVTPEISTTTGETVPISNSVNAPVFAMRSAQTGVVVPDGKTVVIGGLMEDSKTKDKRKVPILGDIPGLGALFHKKNDEKSKTELLIFLTPHVVEDSGELDSMSAAERRNAPLSQEAFPPGQVDRFIGAGPPTEDASPAAASEPKPEPKDAKKPEQKKGNKGQIYKSMN